MAFVVLLSTMSFTVDMHYCGDTLVDTAIFHKATNCGMDMENPSSEGCAITKSDCCNDKQIVVDGQDELKISFDTLTLEQQIFVATFIHSYLNLFEGQNETIVPFKDYNPPFLIRDIQKLHETYLI